MNEDAEQTAAAVARLTADQQRLVGACLAAAANGPYLSDDDEFHAIMGLTRAETAEVTTAWPDAAANGLTFLAVNNALNNLLGYPHSQWRQLRQEIGGDEEAVAQALMAWRDEDRREAGGKGYFDALI